ncbi:MAG: ABC transporter permease [Coriobacteriia bacterium]|nr:ABC transporter permease [Coriobacteriia bacterium]
MSDMLLSAVAQGIIWSLMGLGIFVSFRVLREADLTAEASFTLGAVSGAQALAFGLDPALSVLISFLAGAAAGAITGILATKLKINVLISGIITMTSLYSINLAILGKANLSLNSFTTFREALAPLGLARNLDTVIIGALICAIIIVGLVLFFKTEMGQALIATGDNVQVARALGIRTDEMKMLGLMLANGLVAMSGNLVAQDNGYADIGMGVGTVVLGLAAVILGEVLIRNVSLPMRLVAIIIGAIVYRLLLMLVLQLHFNANDFKLFSGIILALCLAIPMIGKKRNSPDALNLGGE